jgi:hypothetical protein
MSAELLKGYLENMTLLRADSSRISVVRIILHIYIHIERILSSLVFSLFMHLLENTEQNIL